MASKLTMRIINVPLRAENNRSSGWIALMSTERSLLGVTNIFPWQDTCGHILYVEVTNVYFRCVLLKEEWPGLNSELCALCIYMLSWIYACVHTFPWLSVYVCILKASPWLSILALPTRAIWSGPCQPAQPAHSSLHKSNLMFHLCVCHPVP